MWRIKAEHNHTLCVSEVLLHEVYGDSLNWLYILPTLNCFHTKVCLIMLQKYKKPWYIVTSYGAILYFIQGTLSIHLPWLHETSKLPPVLCSIIYAYLRSHVGKCIYILTWAVIWKIIVSQLLWANGWTLCTQALPQLVYKSPTRWFDIPHNFDCK